MSYFSQMAGLAVQNFVSAAVGMAVLVAVIRGIRGRAGDRARQLLAGPHPDPALHPAAAVDRRRADPRLAGRDPDAQRLRRRRHARRAAAQTLALGPGRLADRDQAARHERRRLLQRQLRLSRSRTRRAFSNFVEMLFILLIPAALVLHLRAHGRQPPPGLGALRGDGGADGRRARASPTPPSSTARPLRSRPGSSSRPAMARRAATWRARSSATGSSRAPQWAAVTTDASNGSVNSAHDSLHRDRGRGAAGEHDDRRGDLRRGRLGPLRDAAVRPADRLHRRADGRANARVPRQEDRGSRDQAGDDRGPGDADRGARVHRPRRSRPSTARPRSTTPVRRASPRPSTPSSRRATTTARRSPATPVSCSRTRPATPAPTGSPSPTSWAGSRCSPGASR